MKTYHGLWEQFISEDNIRLAVKKAAKGKKNKRSKAKLKAIKADLDPWLPVIKSYAEDFHNAEHTPMVIYDGTQKKQRTIIVPTYMEQIIHHMAVNVLEPIFMKGMYAHTYGSIPKRGPLKGKKHIEKAKMSKYALKMDIRHYFDSIDQDVLIAKLGRIIKDERFMALLTEIIRVVPHGIPLGFYTSQWFANFYLQDLDHYITEHIRAGKYDRYMDDMVIRGNNKRQLHRAREQIAQYLSEELHVKLKGNWQIFRTWYKDRKGKKRGKAIDFMGYCFYRDRVTLRRRIYFKSIRKARKLGKKEKISWYEATQMVSYCGWWKHSDTYKAFEDCIASEISVRRLRKIISNHAKKERRKNDGCNHTIPQQRSDAQAAA